MIQNQYTELIGLDWTGPVSEYRIELFFSVLKKLQIDVARLIELGDKQLKEKNSYT
jgi:hypothetical protein